MIGAAVLLLVLLGPALAAWATRTTPGALTVAAGPGAFCLLCLFRLWQTGQADPRGCGMGAGIMLICALFAGLSAALALGVAMIRHSAHPLPAPDGTGITPQPSE